MYIDVYLEKKTTIIIIKTGESPPPRCTWLRRSKMFQSQKKQHSN